VLKNKFGIKDEDQLEALERSIGYAKLLNHPPRLNVSPA
jgi:hypothetical protein